MKRTKVPSCRWVVKAKNWADCGKPSVYQVPCTGLFYCAKHAAVARNYVQLLGVKVTEKGKARK